MNKIKILLARFTLDGHDRGIITIINACREAGMEVIYIHFNDVKQVLKSAIEEDVDVIGITSSMGQHLYVAPRFMAALREEDVKIPVLFGGVIPTVDIPKLTDLGIKGAFGPGSSPGEAVEFITKLALEKVPRPGVT